MCDAAGSKATLMKDLINQWCQQGVISAAQEKRMLADLQERQKQRAQLRQVAIIATIGALMLGTGVILFIAANWQAFSVILKMGVLFAFTLGALWLGYHLAFQRQTYPTLGRALLFLSALLIGADIFLLAQLYHVQAGAASLVLLWLVAILPLLYIVPEANIAWLVSILWYVWIFNAVFSGHGALPERFVPVLMLSSAILLFAIGSLHQASERLALVARIVRLAGLKIMLIALFLLSFEGFSVLHQSVVQEFSRFGAGVFIGFAILAFALLDIAYIRMRRETSALETAVGTALLIAAGLLLFFPSRGSIYMWVFNIMLFALLLLLLNIGLKREDMSLINMSMAWLFVYLFSHYVDMFWDMLPTSWFFMSAGLILVLGGGYMERKRRDIKGRIGAKGSGRRGGARG
ncbi:hypothetical protein AUJ68_02365 [Candidatus Woesearchaeota archaeon CG1_02_57_44]|nr:MAG: hypothetical protein AUJ68_02365 [Candidatus Woesearchaeota archaeon CG1_02_57_44]